MQREIQGIFNRTNILKGVTEHDIDNLAMSVENFCYGMSKRVNARNLQTEKEFDGQGHEIINTPKTVLPSISEQKAATESTVAHLKQEINQNP